MLKKLTYWFTSLFVRSEAFQTQGSRRHPLWQSCRDNFVKNKKCSVCCSDKDLEVHHKKPVHEYPELELEEKNLVVLCSRCHFFIGHLYNYATYNDDVDNAILYFRLLIKRAKARLRRRSSSWGYNCVPKNMSILRQACQSCQEQRWKRFNCPQDMWQRRLFKQV